MCLYDGIKQPIGLFILYFGLKTAGAVEQVMQQTLLKRGITEKLLPFELQCTIQTALIPRPAGVYDIGSKYDDIPGHGSKTLIFILDMQLPFVDLQDLKSIMPMRNKHIVGRFAFVVDRLDDKISVANVDLFP